ncbi:MAG: BrnT family toxin [Candidatus Omnitrophica bacterium]|nr:BrnT family toxin [Candidatus Omnitrophota bacterium]
MIQISNFDWDEQNLEHIHNHFVKDYEVEDVLLFDEPIYYRRKENKYCAFGISNGGRYLFIVFVVKDTGLIRVITARNMTNTEKNLYNKRR